MPKLLYFLALAAAVIGVMDLSGAQAGSKAQLEAGFLFISVPVLALLGFLAGRMTTKICPACAERVKKNASICKHCGTVL
jgi:hypothetical protein